MRVRDRPPVRPFRRPTQARGPATHSPRRRTADLLRSSFKQHEYGDIIPPLTVMCRLDVVLEPTKRAVLAAAARPLPSALHDTMLKRAAGVDFHNTSEFTMRGLL